MAGRTWQNYAKTGELSGLPLDGEGPKHPIREFVMAKLRRLYPKKSDELTDYKPFECVVWDMLGPFRTPSLGGCRFSHGVVDKSTGTRFVYSVTDASAATFIKVLETFIAFIGSVPAVSCSKLYGLTKAAITRRRPYVNF